MATDFNASEAQSTARTCPIGRLHVSALLRALGRMLALVILLVPMQVHADNYGDKPCSDMVNVAKSSNFDEQVNYTDYVEDELHDINPIFPDSSDGYAGNPATGSEILQGVLTFCKEHPSMTVHQAVSRFAPIAVEKMTRGQ